MNAATVPVLANSGRSPRELSPGDDRSYQVSTACCSPPRPWPGLTPVVDGYLDRGSAVRPRGGHRSQRRPGRDLDGCSIRRARATRRQAAVRGVRCSGPDDARAGSGTECSPRSWTSTERPRCARVHRYTRGGGRSGRRDSRQAAAASPCRGLGGLDLGEGQIGRLWRPDGGVRPPGWRGGRRGARSAGPRTWPWCSGSRRSS